MAANGARRALQSASSSTKAIFSRSSTSTATNFTSQSAKLNGIGSSSSIPVSSSRFSLRRLSSSKAPAELGGALSLMPLHSVTASALFTSLLSLSNNQWGCLSEGFATPL